MPVNGPGSTAEQRAPYAQLFSELMNKFAASRQAPPPAADRAAEQRIEVVRQIVRATLAQDERGARLREAWRMVGLGLLAVLREMADQAPAQDA